MLQKSQLDKLKNYIGIAKTDIKNISISPYVLEELIDSHEQLTEMLVKEKKRKQMDSEIRKNYSAMKNSIAAKDEALVKIGTELRIYKSKCEKLSSRLGVTIKKGHWSIVGNQAMCDVCHGMTFLGDLDEELPYNFCPNCGIKMERIKR